jgi:hypothetical protein
MAILDCEIVPRHDATPAQLRDLGLILAGWAGRESADTGILHFISRNALADLSNGNRPPTFLEQYQEMLNETRALSGNLTALDPEAQALDRAKLKEMLGDHGPLHRLFFQVRGSYATRGRILSNLRENIPAEMVEDVLVADRSWETG